MVDKKFLDNLEYKVTGACIEVHKALGSGLLESIYHKCLMRELELQGVNFTSEHLITIEYKNAFMNTEVRADLYIENCMVLELKAVEKIQPIHQAQILTYMKLLNAPCGLLINFNCINIVADGKKSFVNDVYKRILDR